MKNHPEQCMWCVAMWTKHLELYFVFNLYCPFIVFFHVSVHFHSSVDRVSELGNYPNVVHTSC